MHCSCLLLIQCCSSFTLNNEFLFSFSLVLILIVVTVGTDFSVLLLQ